MKAILSTLFLVAAWSSCTAVQKNWALLIAGSNTYMNYRHQADICHAYHVLHKNGIPDEQIVVMMYDDIANNSQNPFKGNIINQPGGPNVYPGVLKDYTGKDITPETFLAALQGNSEEVKRLTGKKHKVIASGPEDHVFVYYSDHGGPGVLGMPDDVPLLKATQINKALKKMHAQKKFAKLTFYIEACESGSIFSHHLHKNLNIYATTASNPAESSYAVYFDNKRNTYLADVYSIKWINDTQLADVRHETLQTQFERVKAQTNTSQVMQYGNTSMASEFLSDFMAGKKSSPGRSFKFTPAPAIDDAVPSELVPIMTLKRQIQVTPENSERRASLEQQLVNVQRRMADTHTLFLDIARTVNRELTHTQVLDRYMSHHEPIGNWDCYETALDVLSAYCPGMRLNNNDFALRKLFSLVNLCNHESQSSVVAAIEAVTSTSQMCNI